MLRKLIILVIKSKWKIPLVQVATEWQLCGEIQELEISGCGLWRMWSIERKLDRDIFSLNLRVFSLYT